MTGFWGSVVSNKIFERPCEAEMVQSPLAAGPVAIII